MVRYGAWQIGFFNAGGRPKNDGIFGCSTCGAVTGRQFHMAQNTGFFSWGAPVRGCVFAGGYDDVSRDVENCAFKPTFIFALFARDEGIEDFLVKIDSYMPGVPIAGGLAYSGDGSGAGELAPEARDVALLFCESDMFMMAHKNVLEARGGIYEFDAEGERTLKRLREPDMPWESAAAVVSKLSERYAPRADQPGVFAFSDNDGMNLRVSQVGKSGRLVSGVSLPKSGFLHPRTSDALSVAEEVIEFAQTQQAMVIADDGFMNMIKHPFSVPEGTTVIFLPGQIAGGRYANLMLNSIRR